MRIDERPLPQQRPRALEQLRIDNGLVSELVRKGSAGGANRSWNNGYASGQSGSFEKSAT
jgi:hypothetical protein